MQIRGITDRKSIYEHNAYNYSGGFPSNCQQDWLPYNLKLLISTYGPSLKSEENQTCLTARQIILFNVKKAPVKDQVKSRHSLDREPPLLGLNVHSLFLFRLID